ncbi:hypothetical protein BDF21DRAFT_496690 [Thamnidium elegans]|nr:hypothetical protein BDF21DRAFT_496690 [Thamnidium elegans]
MTSKKQEREQKFLWLNTTTNANKGKSSNPVKKTKPTCWNCNSTEHYTRECTNPCKLCKGTGHKHYECKQYKKNNASPQEGMLIEEDLCLAEKRKQIDVSNNGSVEPYPTSKSKRRMTPKVTRSGKVYNKPVIVNKELPLAKENNTPININKAEKSDTNNQVEDVVMTNVDNNEDIVLPTSESTQKTTVANNEAIVLPTIDISKEPTVVGVKKNAKKPKHPLLPMKRSESYEDKNKKVDDIVDSLLNEPVHHISLTQFTEISPVARSKIKKRITKPHVKLSKGVDQTVLLGENRITLPKGKRAPRTFGKVNGATSHLSQKNLLYPLRFSEQLTNPFLSEFLDG